MRSLKILREGYEQHEVTAILVLIAAMVPTQDQSIT